MDVRYHTQRYSAPEADRRKRSPLSPVNKTPEESNNKTLSGKFNLHGKALKSTNSGDAFAGRLQKTTLLCRENTEVPQQDELFFWRRKHVKEGVTNISRGALLKAQKRRVEQNKEEIESVKRRQDDRYRRKLECQQRLQNVRDESDVKFHSEWQKQEERFMEGQAALRSDIRLKQGRGEPIDHLAKYTEYIHQIHVDGSSTGPGTEQFNDISTERYIETLSLQDVGNLVIDVDVYRQIHGEEHTIYWQDIKTVAQHYNDDLHAIVASEQMGATSGFSRPLFNRTVKEDAIQLLGNKSVKSLSLLEAKIKKIIIQPDTDVSYWEWLQQQVHFHQAKMRLDNVHGVYLRTLYRYQTNTMVVNRVKPELVGDDIEEVLERDEHGKECLYKIHVKLTPETQLDQHIQILDPCEDNKRLQDKREEIINQLTTSTDVLSTNTKEVDHKDLKHFIEQSNIIINTTECDKRVCLPCEHGEVPIETETVSWVDNITPQKPRFFNRVFTGYVWNRYNRTHYDKDSPPPKKVMGYSFTIQYPDLLDPTQSPGYVVSP